MSTLLFKETSNINASDSIIYLASPYSDPDDEVMISRWIEVCRLASILMKLGYIIYSPIVHNHPIAVMFNLPRDIEFWSRYGLPFLRVCKFLLVAKMEGWKESKGIKEEIEIARNLFKPVYFFNIETYKISLISEE